MNWWQAPLVALDLETTGLSAEIDRIVTAAVVTVTGWTPDGVPVVDEWSVVIDPGVDIPTEASDIHGWTTERVRAQGGTPERTLRAIIHQLFGAMAGNGKSK